jgi:hypothetical protein
LNFGSTDDYYEVNQEGDYDSLIYSNESVSQSNNETSQESNDELDG